jgi:hypothetical protein
MALSPQRFESSGKGTIRLGRNKTSVTHLSDVGKRNCLEAYSQVVLVV